MTERVDPVPAVRERTRREEAFDEESLRGAFDAVDSRKTAEAIMKKLLPGLYLALVEAGDIEE